MSVKDDGRIAAQGEEKAAESRRSIVDLIESDLLGDVTIELDASLGTGRLTLGMLASMKKGEVIELATPLNGEVVLSLNGKPVARGELVAVDDRFAVKVTDVAVRNG